MPLKPLLVCMLLTLAALACYSDSPFYPYELTPAPPTATPAPTPQAGQARLAVGDLAFSPTSVTEAAFRLELTRYPEPLRSDLSNKAPQPCSQNAVVEVLYSGVHLSGAVYHLIDCNGAVGWAHEDSLLGPVQIVTNNRALTNETGLDENRVFKIEVSDPPFRENDPFRQRLDCRLNDTVDVVAMIGFSTGELYYKIRCPNPLNPAIANLGWVVENALFGPVRFRNGEKGIVAEEADQIALRTEPDGGDVVATCERGQTIQITDTPVVRLGDELFYEVTCAQGIGWANQDFLVGPLPYEEGTRVLVTAPGVQNSAATQAPIAPDPETPPEQLSDEQAAEPESAPLRYVAPLTNTPGAALVAEQIVGECADATITTIQDFAGVDGEVYALVECEGVVGWLDQTVLYGRVGYAVGDTVLLAESALLGFNQRGIYLSIELFDIEGPSGGASVIAGECAFDFDTFTPIPAELLDVGYYRSSTGNVVGVFYRAACQDKDGQRIEGWINQRRISARAE